ncbi:MAG: hypothetical protein ACI90V_003100, partial [Bacillariaceae sp.]
MLVEEIALLLLTKICAPPHPYNTADTQKVLTKT